MDEDESLHLVDKMAIYVVTLHCSVDFSTWGPFIIIFVIIYLIFIGSRIKVTIVDLVINLNGLGIVGFVGNGVVKVGDILLMILVITLLVRWVRGLLAN